MQGFNAADALQAKWGPRQEGQGDCQVEVEDPISGNMSLPQKPFGNMMYLQRFWVEEDPFFKKLPILAGLGARLDEGEDPEWYKEQVAAGVPKEAESASAGARPCLLLSIALCACSGCILDTARACSLIWDILKSCARAVHHPGL